MPMMYSSTRRAADPRLEPDVYILHSSDMPGHLREDGHYWARMRTGSTDMGETFGPFETEAEAVLDAIDMHRPAK